MSRNPETITELLAFYRELRGCRARTYYVDASGRVGIRGAINQGSISWHLYTAAHGWSLCGSTLQPGIGTTRYSLEKHGERRYARE